MKLRDWKKQLALILSFVLLVGVCSIPATQKAFAAEKATFTVSADKTELHRGDTVTYTVSMSGNETGAGMDIIFTYDADILELQKGGAKEGSVVFEAEKGSLFSDLNDTEPGTLHEVMVSKKILNNGTVFTAVFTVKDSAKGSVSTALTQTELTNDDYQQIDTDYVNQAEAVKVVISATGIQLDQTTLSMNKGDSQKLTASMTPADADETISWSSSDKSVAEVSNDGTVTAKGKGSAVITATAGSVSAVCNVTVAVPLNKIEIKGDKATIKKGETAQLSVSYDPEDTTDDKTVTWKSSDASVASVTADGLVTGLKDGDATITATVGSKSAEYKIHVQEIKLTGISLNKNSLTLLKGKKESLEVVYAPENTTDEKTLTWSSSDPAVASVDAATGEITALKEGTAKITAATKEVNAETKQPFTAEAVVTVQENHLTQDLADSITFSKVENAVMGQKLDLIRIMNLEEILTEKQITDEVQVFWSSSDEKVAAVDEKGVAVFLKKGTVTFTAEITAIDASGKKSVYTAETTLEVKDIPLESIAFDKIIKEMQEGDKDTLKILCNPVDTTDDTTVVWSSSDSSVLSVENGALTAKKAGIITAKVGEKSVSCTITVKAKPTKEPVKVSINEGGQKGSPKTGDTAKVLGYLLLMLLVAGETIILIKRNKFHMN